MQQKTGGQTRAQKKIDDIVFGAAVESGIADNDDDFGAFADKPEPKKDNAIVKTFSNHHGPQVLQATSGLMRRGQ